jgi:hypothetical protein
MPARAFSARLASLTPSAARSLCLKSNSPTALQVLGADVMVRADDLSLEQREVGLHGVGMLEAAAHVFLDRMVDRAMPAELLGDRRIHRAFVGHDV